MADGARQVPPPIALLAELTHRCPLSCPYCSNPVDLSRREAELSAADWAEVFRQAAALGVLQVHLSGGEPASRRDLEEIAAAARGAGLYVNLITSGIGLTADRIAALAAAGVDHVQLSVQGTTAASADRVGGYRGGFARKMEMAGAITAAGLALTLNVVMHRHNLDELPEVFDLAERLGARRVEVACVQFQGWALENRAVLQPTRAQVDEAKRLVAAAREGRAGRLVIDFVPPDYYADLPKACMGGWGSTGLTVAPDGAVLPCHAAQTIPGMEFANVREVALAEIWYRGPAFAAFRGTEWMPEPCRSCDRREVDFGGCRCQAMAVLGDAGAPDPVCRRTPGRARLEALMAAEGNAPGLEAARWRRIGG
ncbi:MAG: pyrroloquinoline quinone biosynthesis protein PqqE [Paracoccaceae bacterium]